MDVNLSQLPEAWLARWGSDVDGCGGRVRFLAELADAVLRAEEWDGLLDSPFLAREGPWVPHLALAVAVREPGLPAQMAVSLGDRPRFIPGSVRTRGPLVLSAPLIVAGDLHVDGPVVDSCREGGWLVVGGNVEAEALVTDDVLLIAGDCRVRDFVWGDYRDTELIVDGTVRAPLLILTDDHSLDCGDAQAGTTLHDPAGEALGAYFVDEALDGGRLSRANLLHLFRAGEPALRTTRTRT